MNVDEIHERIVRINQRINNVELAILVIETQIREYASKKQKREFELLEENDKVYLTLKDELRKKKDDLSKEEDDLRKEKDRLDKYVVALVVQPHMDIDFPPFDPTKYAVDFPFFAPNGESYLTLRGRDNLVEEINSIVLPVPSDRNMRNQKYWPIIISTSRGMGKTFLLKMIGLQKVKDELKCVLFEDAKNLGRIISFDFSKVEHGMKQTEDVPRFLARLMVYFLCRLLSGSQVDGINFKEIPSFTAVNGFETQQKRFNDWKKYLLMADADKMMDEYIRLTNLAFKADCSTPPVFLFDEVQCICIPTSKESTFTKDGTKMHTILSWMLTQLAGKHGPISISAGTNHGDIISITETSPIIPQVFSLTPLVDDYWDYWKESTDHFNRTMSDPIKIEGDEDLIVSLIFASYQIPRLLNVAHQTWYRLRQTSVTNNLYFMEAFEEQAIEYYSELGSMYRQL